MILSYAGNKPSSKRKELDIKEYFLVLEETKKEMLCFRGFRELETTLRIVKYPLYEGGSSKSYGNKILIYV